MENRDNQIIKTSIIGILTNILLVVFKMTIGFLSNSIAIILDAVNNLSDAMSSVITIIGTKLAGRKADKKHPLGHGRIEYLTSTIIAAIVLYAGATSLIESIKSIINKETSNYTNPMLIIIAVAVLVKILLGRYVKKKGEEYNSGALVASGSDAMFDAILSASVLATAIIYKFAHISLEPYVAIVISIMIIKSGIEMLQETLNEILGGRADRELVSKVKDIISSFENVRGAYDLFIYNYGPDKNYASVHVEVPDVMTIDEYDVLVRKIEKKVYEETGVILTGVGAYSYNTKDDKAAAIRSKVQEIVFKHEYVIQMHGFNVDIENKKMRFDVVLSFDTEEKEELESIKNDLKKEFADYEISIIGDIDV